MSEDIKISIIIPVYNVERYLNECVDSVLNQTYKNLEVILVDDGSTDNSPKICDEYAVKDTRVNVIHKKNGGSSSARNAGISMIKGDFFAFLDSDDYWNDSSFLKNIFSIKKNNKNIDLIIFGYTQEKNILLNHVRNTDMENEISQVQKDKCFEQLIKNDKLQSSAWNKIINSRLLSTYDMNFVEGIYSEDIDWTARLVINSENISYFDDYVYFYRKNEESITHNITKKNIIDLTNQIIRIVDLSKKIENELYYEWYMNYCAYQYITFLNCIVTIKKFDNIKQYEEEMKKYRYLLKYNVNKKVKIVSVFNKILGYKGMLSALKVFLKVKK